MSCALVCRKQCRKMGTTEGARLIMNDEIEVKFNLKCFIFGHIWSNGNNENDWNWCDRCFKEGWIK